MCLTKLVDNKCTNMSCIQSYTLKICVSHIQFMSMSASLFFTGYCRSTVVIFQTGDRTENPFNMLSTV